MGFLRSKKAIGFMLGILSLFLADIVGLDQGTVTGIVGLVASYLVSQGVADIGKGKKEAENGKEKD